MPMQKSGKLHLQEDPGMCSDFSGDPVRDLFADLGLSSSHGAWKVVGNVKG